jgi:uncharacterized damage-inducible protein DinB
MKTTLQKLISHMKWADGQVLTRLRSAPEDEASLKWYAHVLAAERVWYLRLHNQDWTTQRVWPSMSLDECAALAEQNAAQFSQYVARLADSDFVREVRYTNSAGDTFANAVVDILIHVALHGVHHRGQIASSLRAHGDEPPALDYIRFARGK